MIIFSGGFYVKIPNLHITIINIDVIEGEVKPKIIIYKKLKNNLIFFLIACIKNILVARLVREGSSFIK